MKDEYVQLALKKNEIENRFEMQVNEYTAIIEYEENNGVISLLHTEVPPELEGKGAATAIIEKTLAYIESEHLKLVPLCPLVVVYIKRHPDWKRILDNSVQNI